MRHEKMPDHGLESFSVGSQTLERSSAHDNAAIRLSGRNSVSFADNPNNQRTSLLRQLHCIDKAHADVVLSGTSADGEHQHRVAGPQAGTLQPLAIRYVPPLIVHAGCELRNVVARRVTLEVAYFSEVVYCVTGVPGTPTGTQNEQPAPGVTSFSQRHCDVVDRVTVDAFGDG